MGPKDGFTIIGTSGKRKVAAARILGLPPAPFRWDGVGTRHTAALALAWALRGTTSCVAVRSESGKVHVMVSSLTKVEILRCQPLGGSHQNPRCTAEDPEGRRSHQEDTAI